MSPAAIDWEKEQESRPWVPEHKAATRSGCLTVPVKRDKDGGNKVPACGKVNLARWKAERMTGAEIDRAKKATGYGIVSGWTDAGFLFILDCETHDAFQDVRQLLAFNGVEGWVVRSGSTLDAAKRKGGGGHVYLLADQAVRTRGHGTQNPHGIEVRGEGSYAVGPGCLHADGGRYAWESTAWATLPCHPLERLAGILSDVCTIEATGEPESYVVPEDAEPRLVDMIAGNTTGDRSRRDMSIFHQARRWGFTKDRLSHLYQTHAGPGTHYGDLVDPDHYFDRTWRAADVSTPQGMVDPLFDALNLPRPALKTLEALYRRAKKAEREGAASFPCTRKWLAMRAGISERQARTWLRKHQAAGFLTIEAPTVERSEEGRILKGKKVEAAMVAVNFQTVEGLFRKTTQQVHTPRLREALGHFAKTGISALATRKGIGQNGVRILEVLAGRGPMTRKALAEAVGVSLATVYRLLSRPEKGLSALGLVEEHPGGLVAIVGQSTKPEEKAVEALKTTVQAATKALRVFGAVHAIERARRAAWDFKKYLDSPKPKRADYFRRMKTAKVYRVAA